MAGEWWDLDLGEYGGGGDTGDTAPAGGNWWDTGPFNLGGEPSWWSFGAPAGGELEMTMTAGPEMTPGPAPEGEAPPAPSLAEAPAPEMAAPEMTPPTGPVEPPAPAAAPELAAPIAPPPEEEDALKRGAVAAMGAGPEMFNDPISGFPMGAPTPTDSQPTITPVQRFAMQSQAEPGLAEPDIDPVDMAVGARGSITNIVKAGARAGLRGAARAAGREAWDYFGGQTLESGGIAGPSASILTPYGTTPEQYQQSQEMLDTTRQLYPEVTQPLDEMKTVIGVGRGVPIKGGYAGETIPPWDVSKRLGLTGQGGNPYPKGSVPEAYIMVGQENANLRSELETVLHEAEHTTNVFQHMSPYGERMTRAQLNWRINDLVQSGDLSPEKLVHYSQEPDGYYHALIEGDANRMVRERWPEGLAPTADLTQLRQFLTPRALTPPGPQGVPATR